MSRAPLINPVVPGPDNEELYRAFGTLIDQLERRFNTSGYLYVIPLEDIALDRHVTLIPRVGNQGFNLGRVSMTGGSNSGVGTITTISASSTDYWTFTLYRYFTATDGTRTSRPVPGGTWNTSTTAIRADVPKVLTLKRPLNPGDTLVCQIATTGAPEPFSATLQIEEMFGPEE